VWVFCKRPEYYAVNQSSHILNGDDDDDDDEGRQRLTRAQRLQNQLADYFPIPVGAIRSQCSYINLIQLINYRGWGLA
jgi:hypothetical protein